ncbi:Gamma-aminobutyric acid type B receptor subunit 1 [Lamellibrachia satsuma]|nr:Gamma-aminobutyric acid type B receptor subunit 1 [Lamellibrachia satsuma]
MPGLGMNVLYDLLYNEPTKLMLLGPGCSVVSTFVGQAARMWNLVVLSYGSSSPALSNTQRFPTFFRTHPSATLHNPTRVKLFKKFGWTRIATIQQTLEVFTSTIEDLEERVKNANIEIVVRTSFLTDPTNAVHNLKRQDARIIVGVFYEDMARRVFCEVYKQKVYGPKHVWVIIGWYPDNWYAQPDPNINCTAEEMKAALEGHFTTEGLMLNQDNTTTISGMTSTTFMEKVEQRIGGTNPLSVTGYVEAPLAYDAVWALALALNNTQTRLVKRNQRLSDFTYSNQDIMKEIYGAMNSTNFLGVSGRVAFNSEGDRIAWTQIEQMWDGNYTKMGFYDFASDNLTWFNLEKWPGGQMPQDRTIIQPVLRLVSLSLFIGMCLLASLGIITAISLWVFNCIHSNKRFILLSQPHINNLILTGCIICLSCVFLQGLDGRYVGKDTFVFLCQVRTWVLSIGFTLAYGPMFSKVWTIYRLTLQHKREIRNLSNWEMYMVLGIMLSLDVIVLVTWQVIDPCYRELESFPHETPKDSVMDIEIKPQLEHCSSRHLNIWLGVIFGYKGVALLFGILLAYETRNVKMKQINDSRFVGMSIYNVVVLCLITAPVSLIIGSHQDASFAFVAIAILLTCFLTMGLIFVPKIVEVQHHLKDRLENAGLTDSLCTRDDSERHQRLLQENEELKRQIAQKEERIRQLHKRLHQKTQVTVQRQSHTDHRDSLSGNSRLKDNTPHGTHLSISGTVPTDVIDDSKSCVGDNDDSRTLLSKTPLDSALKKCFKEFLSVDSDSALVPTSLTVRCSQISAISENYSESYC